jgi:hypothetical protein
VILALVAAALITSAIPHVLGLRHAPPLSAAVIWAAALSLRALGEALAAAWLLLFFPATHLFEALTHWCWRHLASAALNGHDVGHVTTFLPTLLGIVSILSVGVAGVRVARALRQLRAASPVSGPGGSVIVGGDAITLAVVGVLRPRVLISAGALLELSDDELDAALAHESAHIARRHRYVVLWAELCSAVARFIPGTRTCVEELAFHLERDADRCALALPVNPSALAAAVRKAADSQFARGRLVLALGASRVEDRLAEILAEADAARFRRPTGSRLIAGLLVAVFLAIAGWTPPVLADGVHVLQSTPAAVDCD